MANPKDIDNAMESLEDWEAKERGSAAAEGSRGRVLVGEVDQFFDRIGVAAIKLTGSIKVGDVIEIGDEEEAVRQKVSSMQINHEDVSEASDGDDIGIKLKHPVPVRSKVYRIA